MSLLFGGKGQIWAKLLRSYIANSRANGGGQGSAVGTKKVADPLRNLQLAVIVCVGAITPLLQSREQPLP